MNNNQYKQPDYGAEMSPVAPQRSALSVLVASSLGLASVVIVISIFILRRMSNANRNKDDEVEYKEFIVPKKESVPVQPSVAQFIQPTEDSSSLFENLGLTRKESVLHHDPNPVDQDSSLGRLQFGLNYDRNAATLSVNIFQAVGLKPADVSGLADPYVRVCLLPEFVHRKSTRAKRATLDPIFEETLKFMCCDLEKLQEMTLCLQVMDYDRFKWDDPMGEVLLPLNRVRLSTNPVFWKNLRKCSAKQIGKGELHLSVCYVTREERLVIGIDKARGLPPKDLNGLADPYVKIWILEDGAKMLKKKTATRPNTLCPIWNESFHFSIPQDKLDNTQIMISVMDHDMMSKNDEIGYAVLGRTGTDAGRKLWFEMLEHDETVCSQWQGLCPPKW